MAPCHGPASGAVPLPRAKAYGPCVVVVIHALALRIQMVGSSIDNDQPAATMKTFPVPERKVHENMCQRAKQKGLAEGKL
jgi:hypothetical protein